MGQVAVVTDTTQYMPSELAEANGIALVSRFTSTSGASGPCASRRSTTTRSSSTTCAGRTQWPTTSQPSVGDFIAVFEPLLAAGKDVFSIHISGGVSGTVESARQAAEALERDGKGGERVRVYDSETAAGGEGMLALVAARRAQLGDDLDTVAAKVAEARENLKMWFCVDTLEFLKRSGRIGGASAWIGSTLKIKPILTLEREMVPVERVRTSARAFERMVDYARQRQASGADGWVVQHIQDPENAERLAERCPRGLRHRSAVRVADRARAGGARRARTARDRLDPEEVRRLGPDVPEHKDGAERADLAEVLARRAATRDEARPGRRGAAPRRRRAHRAREHRRPRGPRQLRGVRRPGARSSA